MTVGVVFFDQQSLHHYDIKVTSFYAKEILGPTLQILIFPINASKSLPQLTPIHHILYKLCVFVFVVISFFHVIYNLLYRSESLHCTPPI